MVAASAGCASSDNKPASPTVSQAVTATQPAAPQDFVSKQYHFRVTLTMEWSESDASRAWDGNKLQGRDSPAFANFEEPVGDRTLVVGAAPVAKGMQLSQWKTAMMDAVPAGCTDVTTQEKTILGGEPALAWTGSCADGVDTKRLAALHGNRGYMVFLVSNAKNDNAVDRRIFESIRASFRFMN
jgi:hypothetical protein